VDNVTVILYRRINDERCNQVEKELRSLTEIFPHRLVVIDVDSSEALQQAYAEEAPVVEIGPYRLTRNFTRQDLLVALGADQDRRRHLENVEDRRYQERLQRGHTLTGNDRFSYWLARRYMVIFNLFVFLYVGLPFLAPVLLHSGFNGAANVIYKIYSPLCHQMAFRSWFLFGEQAVYPRAMAGINGLHSYEEITGLDSMDVISAKNFIGDEVHGFKVALCERDVAIYGGILLFGLIFMITGMKIKPLPWYLWLFVGIIPIGLDGVSQMPSILGWMANWFPWLPLRESTPLLRTITGALFGITTAWYGYPYIEESFMESRKIVEKKMAVISQLDKQADIAPDSSIT
jgi:uncharacterized membrane protein